jgi:hypothetical protein
MLDPFLDFRWFLATRVYPACLLAERSEIALFLAQPGRHADYGKAFPFVFG